MYVELVKGRVSGLQYDGIVTDEERSWSQGLGCLGNLPLSLKSLTSEAALNILGVSPEMQVARV